LETALKPRIMEAIMHLIIVVHVGVKVGDSVEAEDYGGHHQGWANLDQASKHLEVFRFRDLSPTPIP
jgi:hypothetical protein